MPELSVILPARDAEKTIHRAVSSTLRAMPTDSELVVLDDGSTDGTLQALEALSSDRRLRVLHAGGQGGRGVGAALTTLLEHTDSRYVARMDADDISTPWRFKAELRAVRHSADLAFSTVAKLRGRILTPSMPMPIRADAFPFHLLLTNPACHPTLIARREVIEQVGGFRTVPSEDYDLWLRCATAGASIVRVATYGLIYRIHPTQVTASAAWQSASWDDETQAKAFGDLAQTLVGVRLRRLVQIASSHRDARSAELADFEERFAAATRGIRGSQGLFLRRRLAARLTWARGYSRTGAASMDEGAINV